MNILAVGAHFDDVELGCGGSLMVWKDQGHAVSVFVATRSGYSDPQGTVIRSDETARAEGIAASQVLGVDLIEGDFPTLELQFAEPLNRRLLDVVREKRPDLVLAHWPGDTHPDHRALARAALHSGRHVPRFLAYRSNWYESEESFDPRFFVDISPVWERKQRLIGCYRSELARTHESWPPYFQALAQELGKKAGVAYAEGFQVVKWLA
jgi:LmbE family N-acetylglucosaminyl deacetylase